MTGNYHSDTGIDPESFDTTKIVLPSNDFGLFVKTTAPDSSYLIETNPRFTRFDKFIGSDYFLERLDYPGIETLKRLGDAFYESKLIRDEIFARTGRRYIDASIASDNAQFRYLMDNALAARHELQLTPGVTLTTTQIDSLTRDIVWLEVHEVAGQRVLVPRVYLASGPRPRVRGGKILAGENVEMRLASLDNSGLIEAAAGLGVSGGRSSSKSGGHRCRR